MKTLSWIGASLFFLLASGCESTVMSGAGGSGGAMTTSSSNTTVTTTSSTTSGVTTSSTTSGVTTSSTTGSGGGPVDLDGGTDADANADAGFVCMPPAMPLADGQVGTSVCACPCSVEAPAILQAMAQDAIAAYQANGALCLSAWAVPAGGPPPAKCYQPAKAMFSDFHTGDATHGWKCLNMNIPALAEPIHCRFSYFAGSGYLGPAVGGPDPGPMGFEVAAQGDYDGDGLRSTFTITGKIDPVTNQITLTPLFEKDPLE